MATTDGKWYGGYTVDSAADGIHVRKGLDLDTLALPAVRVRIESRRDERVGDVLGDEVPEPVSDHDVGFHEDHGAEYWHVYDGGRLRWVNTLAPGASTSTLYGVRFADPRDVYDVFEPVTVALVRPLLGGDRFAPRLDGREVPKHSMDEALEAGNFESVDALRTEIAAPLGHPGRGPDGANDAQRRPRPAAHGPAIERAGEVDLDPPAPTAIHALDDRSAGGERLFVKVLVREGAVPRIDESVSTAGDVLGRRIRDHRSGHELLETILATAHLPDALAAVLAERDEVGDVLVAIVDETMPRAPDGARSMTEFALLQREVEAVSPDRIETELESDRDDVAVSDLVSAESAGTESTDEAVRDSDRPPERSADRTAAEAFRAEIERLRRRVASLEAEVARLQGQSDEEREGEEPDPDGSETRFRFGP